MLVTAHGGSFDTGRNSKKYFEKICSYAVDVLEVDIWKWGRKLYLSHLPSLVPNRCLSLSYAFEIVAKYNFKINCDVKQHNLIKSVIELAKEKGVLDKILFTGNTISLTDIKNLTSGEIYLNRPFFKIRKPKPSDVKNIKDYIDSFNNPRIKGINFNHLYCTEEFLDECKSQGVAVSVFVVDSEIEQRRLAKHSELHNITTNYPDKVLELIGRTILR